MLAEDITTPPRKAAVVLTLLGLEIQELARTLPAVEGHPDDEYSQLTAKLKVHFDSSKNPTYERSQLHALVRKDGESFGTFVSRLRLQADRCGYSADQRESTVLECAVARCSDRDLQRRFFSNKNLTLPQALELAKQEEEIRAQIDNLSLGVAAAAPLAAQPAAQPAAAVHALQEPCARCRSRKHQSAECPFRNGECYKCHKVGHTQAVCRSAGVQHRPPPGSPDSGGGPAASRCSRCRSNRHQAASCPFKNAECHKCRRVGHTKVACRQSTQPMPDRAYQVTDGVTRDDQSEHEEYMYSLYTLADRVTPMTASVLINGAPVTMQVDTGASRTVMNRELFNKLWPVPPTLQPSDASLLTYTKEVVPVLGVASVQVVYGNQTAVLPLVVVNTNGPPLLGREWLHTIRLDWKTILNRSRDPVHSLAAAPREEPDLAASMAQDRAEFKDLFLPGLGKYNVRKVSIDLDPDMPPIFHKHRPPPFAQREAIEKELDRQVELGILEPVASSRWAAPVCAVKKADSSVRLCGCYDTTVNKASKLERYPLPRVDELFAAMAGGSKFTKIDLREAYLQLEMDDNSKEALTINTHKGLYRPNRLCYGVKSAVSIFQREMETLLAGIPNVAVFLDDIAVTGSSPASHRANVREVLRRLSSAGLRVNEEKSVWLANEVNYLGFRISAAGVQTTAEKTRAVLDAPEPCNLGELWAYLGMIQYYA